MLELSQDVICGKLVIQPRIQEPHHHIVNSQVVAHQYKPSVWHHPKPNLGHCVATVLQVRLKQIE